MLTENKLRVPPFTREDIKAMVEEMNDHVFIDLKGMDLETSDSKKLDNGETYQKLLNLPVNKIVVFTNFTREEQFNRYAEANSLKVFANGLIACSVQAIGDDISVAGNYALTFESDGSVTYDEY